MKKLYLVPVIAAFIFAGCDKDNEPKPDPPYYVGLFQTEKEFSLGPIIMYTQQGIITDQALIKSYLERYDLMEVERFDFDRNPMPVQYNDFTIRVLENNKAYYKTKNATDSIAYDIYKINTNSIVVASEDNMEVFVQRAPPFECDGMYRKILSEKPGMDCPIPAGANSVLCYYKSYIPINFDNNQASIPFFTYAGTFKNGDWTCIVKSFGPARDVVNDKLQQILTPGDTVVIQTRTLQIKKTN